MTGNILSSVTLGETVEIHFHLDNRSTQSAQLWAQLVQKSAFKRDPYYLDSQEVLTACQSEVSPSGRSQSDIIRMCIPYNSLATFDSSALEIHYVIRLYFLVSEDPLHFDDIAIAIN